MKIAIKKINDEVVKAVPLLELEDKRPVLGANLFPEPYANIFLCSRKKSGKTSVIYNIIKKCASRNTTIIAFVSTLYKDVNWLTIQKYCSVNHIPFVGHTSLIAEDGTNLLQELVDELKEKAQTEVEQEGSGEKKMRNPIIMCDEDDDDDEPKKKKSKYKVPEYMIILDDLSSELKNPALISLLKKNRHFLLKIIVSSQYLNDLDPQSRKQMDYFLVFRGQPLKKLDEIHRDADIAVPNETFYLLYKTATKEPFSFLYIDCANNIYRRNFNSQFEIA